MKKLPLLIYALCCVAIVTALNSCTSDSNDSHPFIVTDDCGFGPNNKVYCDKATALSVTRVQCIIGTDTTIMESDSFLFIKSNPSYNGRH